LTVHQFDELLGELGYSLGEPTRPRHVRYVHWSQPDLVLPSGTEAGQAAFALISELRHRHPDSETLAWLDWSSGSV
jgi:hypothetical protein